jgi:hypothetical protein
MRLGGRAETWLGSDADLTALKRCPAPKMHCPNCREVIPQWARTDRYVRCSCDRIWLLTERAVTLAWHGLSGWEGEEMRRILALAFVVATILAIEVPPARATVDTWTEHGRVCITYANNAVTKTARICVENKHDESTNFASVRANFAVASVSGNPYAIELDYVRNWSTYDHVDFCSGDSRWCDGTTNYNGDGVFSLYVWSTDVEPSIYTRTYVHTANRFRFKWASASSPWQPWITLNSGEWSCLGCY